jgi:hypothetical protein
MLPTRILVFFVCCGWYTARACENSNHDHADHDEKSMNSSSASRHLRERLLVEPSSTNSNRFGDGPFWINDFQWESRQALIESGSRCLTRDPTTEERTESLELLREYLNGDGRKLQGTPNIPVHFVVISSSSGEGGVSDSVINAQMSVLNGAFAPTFSFSLLSVQRVTNDNAYACSSDSDGFKQSYHRGGAETLNFYTCNSQGGVLGWATLPFSGAGNGDDGVVVSFSTLPGGSNSPYNEGDVSLFAVVVAAATAAAVLHFCFLCSPGYFDYSLWMLNLLCLCYTLSNLCLNEKCRLQRTKLDIGLVCYIRLRVVAAVVVMAFQTLLPKNLRPMDARKDVIRVRVVVLTRFVILWTIRMMLV